MFDSIIFIFNNLWYIIGFIIISIPFYILFYKLNGHKLNFKNFDDVNKKNLYLNRIDIIGNKVYIIIAILLAVFLKLLFS